MISAIFADLSTTYAAVKQKFKAKLDYGKLLNSLEDDTIIRAYAYSNQDHDEASTFAVALKHLGYIPKFSKNQNWNVELTLDVIKLANKIEKAIFITCDINYNKLFEWCKYKGIYVHLFCSENVSDVADQITYIAAPLLESI